MVTVPSTFPGRGSNQTASLTHLNQSFPGWVTSHIVGSQMTCSNHTIVFATHLSHTWWQPCCTNQPMHWVVWYYLDIAPIGRSYVPSYTCKRRQYRNLWPCPLVSVLSVKGNCSYNTNKKEESYWTTSHWLLLLLPILFLLVATLDSWINLSYHIKLKNQRTL